MTEEVGDVVAVGLELGGDDRDRCLRLVLDLDRVGDRVRRARTARTEADERAVDLTREVLDLLLVPLAAVAGLAARVDLDGLRAAGLELLLPVLGDELLVWRLDVAVRGNAVHLRWLSPSPQPSPSRGEGAGM